ncbi:MAG: zinc-ribbon domain-containing protein [Deltaproteobacteria bacterium]|jgi:predicted Zn finger-like uncharacterized protein|nr:zinc-ribbon domain-containing protein [Deltaproteobacteria bacterium]
MYQFSCCPNCKLRIKVAKEKIPPGGALVICPRCRDKFFIAGFDLAEVLETPSEPSVAQPRRRVKVEGLASASTNSRYSIDLASTEWGEVQTKTRFGNKPIIGLIILALLGLVFALGAIYWEAAETDLGGPPPPPVNVSRSEYAFPQVKSDLLYLRRKLFDNDRYHKVVNFRGVESRLFKYLQNILAPSSCQEIISLELDSQSPREGVVVKAVCFNRRERGAQIDIRFLGGWAVVRNNENGLRLDVPLLASAQKAWDRGERQYREPEKSGVEAGS